jgi:hypothetical protein
VVTELELKQLLKAHGWGLHYHARRGTGKRYAYAQRKQQGKKLMKYLCPESQIATLEAEQVLQKLPLT